MRRLRKEKPKALNTIGRFVIPVRRIWETIEFELEEAKIKTFWWLASIAEACTLTCAFMDNSSDTQIYQPTCFLHRSVTTYIAV